MSKLFLFIILNWSSAVHLFANRFDVILKYFLFILHENIMFLLAKKF